MGAQGNPGWGGAPGQEDPGSRDLEWGDSRKGDPEWGGGPGDGLQGGSGLRPTDSWPRLPWCGQAATRRLSSVDLRLGVFSALELGEQVERFAAFLGKKGEAKVCSLVPGI